MDKPIDKCAGCGDELYGIEKVYMTDEGDSYCESCMRNNLRIWERNWEEYADKYRYTE